MHRRFFLAAAAHRWALASLALVAARSARSQPAYTVSAEQLQEAVAQRFPLRYPVAGLVDVDVQAPRLSLLPESNRLSAAFALKAAGPALRRSHGGTLEVEFALRYEAIDRSLRAHQLRVGRLDFPQLAAGGGGHAQQLWPCPGRAVAARSGAAPAAPAGPGRARRPGDAAWGH